MSKVDRLGRCPACNKSWDDGDILQNLNRMSVFQHTAPGAMLKVAGSLGYNAESPTKFSSVIVHQFDGKTLYECPKMSCRHVFVADTGVEYNSLFEFKRGSDPVTRKEEKEEEDIIVWDLPDLDIEEDEDDELPWEDEE